MSNLPRRILVVRTDRLGDLVLTLPMFSILRKRYPDARLALLARRYVSPLTDAHPNIDETLLYDDGGTPRRFNAMKDEIRTRRFDAVFVVHPTFRLALLMASARIPIRIGTGYRWYSFLFNRRVYTHRKTAQRHELEYNLELLTRLDCPVPHPIDPEFGISVTGDSHTRAVAKLREHGILEKEEYIVLHVATGGSAREWPRESFAALCRDLIHERGFRVVLTGTAAERPAVASVQLAIGADAISLAGDLSLLELEGILAGALLLVVNSTGPLHLAVALGVPVLAFFPQIPVMGPGRWGPYTTRARVLVPDRPPECRECRGGGGGPCDCMRSISVDRALRAARELLGTREPPHQPRPHDH
jgi:heptosyltransferase-3